MTYRYTLTVANESEAALLYIQLADALTICGPLKTSCKQVNNQLEIELVPRQWSQLDEDHQQVVSVIADLMAELVLEHYEKQLVNECLMKHYKDFRTEAEEIVDYCLVLLRGSIDELDMPHEASIRRKQMIARSVRSYLQAHEQLNMIGFVRFRLADYREELKAMMDYAVEEYVSNKQYQEFIGLLKYFVYFQDAKTPEIHLIHYGGNHYALRDHLMNPIQFTRAEEVVVETIDHELNYEDLIVSTLISVSPQHVFIHTRDPNTLSIRSIRQIFEGRTTLCTCCVRCQQLLDKSGMDEVNW